VAYATLSRHNGVLCDFRLSPLGGEGHQGVHGAPNALPASVQHVRVDHRSLDVSMTKKLLIPGTPYSSRNPRSVWAQAFRAGGFGAVRAPHP
jgi:hypothetical protein